MTAPLRRAAMAATVWCAFGPFGSGSVFAQAVPAASSRGALEFRFTPTARTQIAIWVEKADGTFVDTVGLTQSVSLFGIGNRPGAAQMNSGFRWPYGRREGVLPVWAHRRVSQPGAQMFRRVIFQDRASEGFASRTSNDSTPDPYYCLSFNQASSPAERKQDFVDAVTCASANRFMSDKGRFVTEADVAAGYAEPAEPAAMIGGSALMRLLGLTSLYPPRRDLDTACGTQGCGDSDTADAATYGAHARQVIPNIDTVTMATPPPDRENLVMFSIPSSWLYGDYVAWVEVNVEGDYNATFNDQTLPTPTQPADKWDSWAITSGYPYRGQPSVVYQVPFQLGPSGIATAVAPSFYGEVDGFDPAGGQLHPMDDRITNDPVGAPGQGVDRLRLMAPTGTRVQVTVRGRDVCGAAQGPAAPTGVRAEQDSEKKDSHRWGVLHFRAPASSAPIAQYQVRFSPAKSAPIIEGDQASFDRASPAVDATDAPQAVTVPITGAPGSEVTVKFGGMQPLTTYSIAVRGVDMCNVPGPFAVAEITTTRINFTQLAGCFIATAAYGSPLEPRVEALRRARDALRRQSPLFSLATDLYYRSGPAAAAVVARSEGARALVRGLLAPVVTVAGLVYAPDTISR